MNHSGFGVASFIISIATGIFIFLVIAFAGLLGTKHALDDNSPESIVVGLAILGCFAVNLLGLALGIAGIMQRDRIRSFSVLGIILNPIIAIAIIALIMFGLFFN